MSHLGASCIKPYHVIKPHHILSCIKPYQTIYIYIYILYHVWNRITYYHVLNRIISFPIWAHLFAVLADPSNYILCIPNGTKNANQLIHLMHTNYIWTQKHQEMRDISSETPDVTTKCTCYDLTNLLVRVASHAEHLPPSGRYMIYGIGYIKRGLEYGVRALVFYGNLRQQMGEHSFPRIPTGNLFCSYRNLRKPLGVHGRMWSRNPVLQFPLIHVKRHICVEFTRLDRD